MDDDKEKIAARILFSAAVWLLVICLVYLSFHAMLSMLRHYNILARHPCISIFSVTSCQYQGGGLHPGTG